MKTITVTNAARNFSDLVSRVHYRGESALLTKGGRPVAKLMPIAQAKSGRELSAVWSTIPHLKPLEAERFASELSESRRRFPSLRSKWE